MSASDVNLEGFLQQLFSPNVITPSQFHESWHSASHHADFPEKKLVREIFRDGVGIFLEYCYYLSTQKKRFHRQVEELEGAAAWVQGMNSEWPYFSFDDCCHYLDIGPEWLRAAMLKMLNDAGEKKDMSMPKPIRRVHVRDSKSPMSTRMARG